MFLQSLSRLWNSKPTRRRAASLMIGAESLEQRALLSAVSIDLAPAAAEVSAESKSVKHGKNAKAGQPAVYGGHWEMDIGSFIGDGDFVQAGTKITGTVAVNNNGTNYIYQFTGKVKGQTLTGHGKLSDPEGVKGTLKLKVIHAQQTVTFDGTTKLKGNLTQDSEVTHGFQI